MQGPRKTAIVHEWFTGMRGGERVIEALCEVFPGATLFALLHTKGSVSPVIERMPIRTSFVQHLPGAARYYRQYLPLFPWAVARFRMEEFDCVISSNHCVAKGVRARPGALHLCYCYTPMRYVWDQFDDYFGPGRAGVFARYGMAMVRGPLQRWDVRTAAHPHHFIAISENIRERIRRIYGRSSDMIYPPVDTARFAVSTKDDGYYLVVSALVPYKRVDLAVRAATSAGERLIVVGQGPEEDRLRSIAGPGVEFTGWRSDREIQQYYAGCRALLFPGEEDFGIVPLEAIACGKPVIAYARGGALETVIDRPGVRTGILFGEQSVESLVEAFRRFREEEFDPEGMRRFALQFDREVFKERFRGYVAGRWAEFIQRSPQVHI
jgi:glycosyltransferase involved in cell wall biosynthesis